MTARTWTEVTVCLAWLTDHFTVCGEPKNGFGVVTTSHRPDVTCRPCLSLDNEMTARGRTVAPLYC